MLQSPAPTTANENDYKSVSPLLEDLDSSPNCVSDEEAMRRFHELKVGTVKGLSDEEFWVACGRS